ncbi:hypothetical protein SEEGA711_21678 [Salmonella enterica subsp. enterica serovar Gaminara str. ATCC BAA-711]|nr:hypothetical protein SEEGA711_21678 [Salmonella enterica subsp. enterica serovar Gaminara str. ATCC BAA-711]
MAHCTEIINLIRFNFRQDTRQVRSISQISIMKMKFWIINMGILIDMINTLCIKRG